jgi:hypothetical protein
VRSPKRPLAFDGSENALPGEVKRLADRPFDGSSVQRGSGAWTLSVEYFARFGRFPLTTRLVWGDRLPVLLVLDANQARAKRDVAKRQ